MLVCLHLVCAGAAGFALLSRKNISLSFLMSGARLAGASGAFLALPAAWPYIASFVVSRNVVPPRNAYLAIYAGVLLLSTVAGVWATVSVSRSDLFGVVVLVSLAQAGAFIWASDRIEDYEDAYHRDV